MHVIKGEKLKNAGDTFGTFVNYIKLRAEQYASFDSTL